MSTPPVVAKLPVSKWDASCDTYLEKRCKADFNHAADMNPFQVYTAMILPILATLAGTIMLTIFAIHDHSYDTPFTFTATTATYTFAAILVSTTAISYIVAYAMNKVDQSKEEQRKQVERATLKRMLQYKMDTDGNITLNDLTISKGAIEARLLTLEGELKAILAKKEKDWQQVNGQVGTFVSSVAKGALALLATIFAAQYLPNFMHDTSAQALAGMAGITAMSMATLSITHECLEESQKKYVWRWLEPVALMALTVLGSVFASQYLPDSLSQQFKDATVTTIAITGVAAMAASLTRQSLRTQEESREYHSNGKYHRYCYDSDHIEGLQNIESKDRDKFLKAYRTINLDNSTTVGIKSWWVPLMIMMLGTLMSCIAIDEFAGVEAKPYLFTASILVTVAMIVSHAFYSVVKTKGDKQLFEAALSAITVESDSLPTVGR